ncbi:unnamed protein product [Didymodactylos carnosus]|uniref:Cell wall hydrolase SleB domain-containing protein n=1 Tax=Didymodactylos carnosus TaxID=1234261 RepID=A0A816CI63_9BILA|nr:unnamed protein product [Didymodactylos carnosus]CAF1624861.1 unnamed protein product [Didymodactylos carnosus]CAF4351809.1 unnamed protein product [Didymodactylos carnosus]CAF4518107.1 unnamed protein product [Didymodactylos carnosus]
MTDLSEEDVFYQTIYAEAQGECEEGQKWVAWVIMNRAQLDKDYWGGKSIKDVCLKGGQFECWNDKTRGTGIKIKYQKDYDAIVSRTRPIYLKVENQDPTGGADHYNNPKKESYPPWTKNCTEVKKIGNHQFYKSKSL